MNISSFFKSCLTVISPKVNAIVLHRIKTGRKLSFKNPTTLADKLVVLKIMDYNHNPLVKQCADKYAVREYIKTKGHADLLNELIAVYDSVDDIEWDRLPKQFAMKWNFGSGYNIICKDKEKLDIPKAIIKLSDWGRKRVYLPYAELQYKNVKKRIIVEKYLSERDGSFPPDFKLYCFNGKCKAILYIAERDKKEHKAAFFDPSWQYLGMPYKEGKEMQYKEFNKLPDAPKSLNTMVAAAEDLADEFPFVRVDFYDLDGKAVFGEMTFTPAGGHDVSEIDIDGKTMGELLKI